MKEVSSHELSSTTQFNKYRERKCSDAPLIFEIAILALSRKEASPVESTDSQFSSSGAENSFPSDERTGCCLTQKVQILA